jgi:hypothetical protein
MEVLLQTWREAGVRELGRTDGERSMGRSRASRPVIRDPKLMVRSWCRAAPRDMAMLAWSSVRGTDGAGVDEGGEPGTAGCRLGGDGSAPAVGGTRMPEHATMLQLVSWQERPCGASPRVAAARAGPSLPASSGAATVVDAPDGSGAADPDCLAVGGNALSVMGEATVGPSGWRVPMMSGVRPTPNWGSSLAVTVPWFCWRHPPLDKPREGPKAWTRSGGRM